MVPQIHPQLRNYAHPEMLVAMIKAASKILPQSGVVLVIHMDHENEEHAFNAIQSRIHLHYDRLPSHGLSF